MSSKELDRLTVLKHVQNKSLTQVEAAELLGVSDRQIINLLKSVKTYGSKGLISKKRGRPSNRRLSASLKSSALKLICQKYEDFKPTLIQEKLESIYSIHLSVETIRQWMIEIHLWNPKQRFKKSYSLRERKKYFGEMILIDGSPHDWFEGRLPPCALIVFVDDATSRLTSLHFSSSESLDAYFQALEKHLKTYGRPLSFYHDHFSAFECGTKKESVTQFKRAMNHLEIKCIFASSSQAKGRVERANRTLQNRLVKEMRLKNICSIEEANAYLDKFREIYNQKFSKEPASQFNAHRSLETGTDLSRLLTCYEEHTLTKDLSFQFHNKFYKILESIANPRGKRLKLD